ncbi:MAG TPA: cation:proton antiporter [Bryobacteraceae bacterium]|nr:cation:proton antiporter [Bryobacteraceae bacterium]
MRPELWYILLGSLFGGIAFSGTLIKRLPVSTAMIYFAVGLILGNQFLGIIDLDLIRDSAFVERCAEVAVLVSLFAAGLKLRAPLRHPKWMLAVRLAFGAMVVTILLAAGVAMVLLELPFAQALLLGAMLAPTDPVLASDVQVDSPFDKNRLRFTLTGEAGLNDGSAFPFVILGLELIAGSDWSQIALHWGATGLIYPVAAGIAIGAATGTLFGKNVLHLRGVHGEALGYNDFLALGLIGVTFGITELCRGYGFLAVFAAGYALRRLEMKSDPPAPRDDLALPLTEEKRNEVATSPDTAPIFLTESILVFNEHYERMTEFAVVIIFGSMFSASLLSFRVLCFVAILLLFIRPISVLLGLIRSSVPARERWLMGWLGLRGIGSIYYISYAVNHGLAPEQAGTLIPAVFATIAASVIIHGITVTPLMRHFGYRE